MSNSLATNIVPRLSMTILGDWRAHVSPVGFRGYQTNSMSDNERALSTMLVREPCRESMRVIISEMS